MPLFKRTLSEFLFRRFVLKHYGSNLLVDLQLGAKKETLEYIKANMPDAPYFEKHPKLVQYVVAEANEPGLYLEFGVNFGSSIRLIASKTNPTIHGFDSFEGIPEDWGSEIKGSYSTYGQLPEVPKNVVLHRGWFSETLPPFIMENDKSVAFTNIDCDLYSSTKNVFDNIGDHIKKDSIIIFDEYLMIDNWRNHEFKAFQEFIAHKELQYEYLAFGLFSKQAVVQIVSSPTG